jgi:CDP-paratose 2-epimerase
MKIFITGIAGFIGSKLAVSLSRSIKGSRIFGIDNLSRRGSETSLDELKRNGIEFVHGDIRLREDLDNIAAADWVIDCAANPSVMAGITPETGYSSRQLTGHNLCGTLNVLEYCRAHKSGLIMMSTSRVYSTEFLNQLPLKSGGDRFEYQAGTKITIPGFSAKGISESFPVTAPLSLYGATKLASETMALEYAYAFGFPVWINRCGVISGPGQFGKIDQGIFAYWAYSCAIEKKLNYIGFGGSGRQVRDCVTPDDLSALITKQLNNPERKADKILNVGGGLKASLSLAETTRICEEYFGRRIKVGSLKTSRAYDIPYYVSDTSKAERFWEWSAEKTGRQTILELCGWAENNKAFIKKLFDF